MPCNFNQRALAQKVKQGIREAGGTPIEFNTISVSDGVTMGAEGMRGSLVSREVIADSIELVARSHGFDGVVCLVACDKTGPPPRWRSRASTSRTDLLHRLDRARFTRQRRHRDGRLRGHRRAHHGTLIERGAARARDDACPGAGACGGQFTANTMAMALEFLGLSPRPGRHPRDPPREGRAAVESAACDGARRARRPAFARSPAKRSRTRSPPWPRPAARRTPRCISSRSRASWRSPSRSRTSTCHAADADRGEPQPGGEYVATDLTRRAAPRSSPASSCAGSDPRGAHRDGRTRRARRDARQTPGQQVVVPIAGRSSRTAASPSSRATSRPRAA